MFRIFKRGEFCEVINQSIVANYLQGDYFTLFLFNFLITTKYLKGNGLFENNNLDIINLKKKKKLDEVELKN